MLIDNDYINEDEFLDKFVYYGLTNINTGFDSIGIKYFTENDFNIILNRVKELRLGIYGIEPWKNGELYDVESHTYYRLKPTDSNWYFRSFEKFKKRCSKLQYSATIFVPEMKK